MLQEQKSSLRPGILVPADRDDIWLKRRVGNLVSRPFLMYVEGIVLRWSVEDVEISSIGFDCQRIGIADVLGLLIPSDACLVGEFLSGGTRRPRRPVARYVVKGRPFGIELGSLLV